MGHCSLKRAAEAGKTSQRCCLPPLAPPRQAPLLSLSLAVSPQGYSGLALIGAPKVRVAKFGTLLEVKMDPADLVEGSQDSAGHRPMTFLCALVPFPRPNPLVPWYCVPAPANPLHPLLQMSSTFLLVFALL